MHEAAHDIELIARHHLEERRGRTTLRRPPPADPRSRRAALAGGLRRLADRLDA